MTVAGIDRAVLVPPLFEGYRNDYARTVAAAHPERFRVMARLNLRATDNALGGLSELTDDPLVAGVRLVFVPFDAGSLVDHCDTPFWSEAARRGLPIMLYAPGQLADVAVLAARHPSLRLAVDHLGFSGARVGTAVNEELEPILELARCPNVAVKMTALPCYSTQPFPHLDLHEPARAVLDAFGADRVFWGSDLSRLPGTYAQAVALTRDHICRSGEEAAAVLGASLMRWLDWSPHPSRNLSVAAGTGACTGTRDSNGGSRR